MIKFFRPKGHVLLSVALVLALCACSPPQDVANMQQVTAGAEATTSTFAVQIVTQDTLHVIQTWPNSHPAQTTDWIAHQAVASDGLIQPGDRISLTVWDNEDSPLLGQAGQKVIAMQDLRVSGAGIIFLPYVGDVRVAGLTATAARSLVEGKLRAIIPSAQVQLNAVAGVQNAVHVIAGVANPGTLPLADAGVTITAALAQSGGIPANMANPQVNLQRGGKVYTIAAEKLLSHPEFDTTLMGNDKIFVQPDSRYFLSLGAAGREAVIDFPRDTITTLEAMSMIGGVNQDMANPKAILVLRAYPAASVSAKITQGPPKARMVFAFDLTTADGLFSAGSFLIQDRDLVLVTQSPLLNTTNTVRLFTGMFTGSRTVFNAVQ
jgi:polysaccharide export outer membrane protein